MNKFLSKKSAIIFLPFQKSVLNVQFQSKPVYYTYFYNFYSFLILPKQKLFLLMR